MDDEMIMRCVHAAEAKRRELINMPLQACYISIVKAVIAQMREPTDKMIMSPDGNTGIANEVWTSMIDCIIND